MVNSLFRKYWYLTVVALLCCAPMAFGQQVTMTLQQPSTPVVGGVYTSPYPFSGITIDGQNFPTAVCDDFADDIYVGESWTANVTQLSGLTGVGTANTTLYFDQGSAANQQTQYDEVAYLVQQLYNPANSAATGDISFAIWSIFDPAAASGDPNTSAVNSWLAAAMNITNYQNINTSDFEILSWDGNTGTLSCPSGDNCTSNNRPQEFIVYTPESTSGILFGADMLGLLGLAIVFRRRLLRPIV